jgi:ribosomal protein L7/L12
MITGNDLIVLTELRKQLEMAIQSIDALSSKVDGDNCHIIMDSFGSNKIAAIRAIRDITKWGLKESKDFVEAAPVRLASKNLSLVSPMVAAQTLKDAGCTVTFCKGEDCGMCDSRFKCFTM